MQGVQEKLCFFQEFSEFDLLRQHLAAICRLENGQPKEATLHFYCVEIFGDMQARAGLQWIWKNTIFPEHPVPLSPDYLTKSFHNHYLFFEELIASHQFVGFPFLFEKKCSDGQTK